MVYPEPCKELPGRYSHPNLLGSSLTNLGLSLVFIVTHGSLNLKPITHLSSRQTNDDLAVEPVRQGKARPRETKDGKGQNTWMDEKSISHSLRSPGIIRPPRKKKNKQEQFKLPRSLGPCPKLLLATRSSDSLPFPKRPS